MHRVELKDKIKDEFALYVGWFLMHRVELKAKVKKCN